MPADVIARLRIEIQGIGVRIIGRRQLQALACDLLEEADERRRAIQLRNGGRQLVQRVPADTATLLVAGQIVAVDLWLDSFNGRNQLRRHIRAEELREVDKRALPYV